LKLLTQIRYRIARKRLKQEHSRITRKRRPQNLENTRSIALLYSIDDEKTYKRVEEFVKILNDRKIKVKVVCYTGQKFTPHFFIPRLLQDILTVKDNNWYFYPVKPFVKDFLAEEYDILIDLTLSEKFPLLYLAALSNSGLKIGRFDETHQEFYDLMIDIPQEATLDYFIEQVMHYLSKINT